MLKQAFYCDVCKDHSNHGFRFKFNIAKVTVSGDKVVNGLIPIDHEVEACSQECAIKRLKKVSAQLFEPPQRAKVMEISKNTKAADQ